MQVPPSFRDKPVDQRRLDLTSRNSYSPANREGALARVQAYRARNNWNANRPPNTTEQRPGTGGFTNPYAQADRQYAEKSERLRAEQFRQEADTQTQQSGTEQGEATRPINPPVNNAKTLRAEAKQGKYGL